MLPCPFCGCKMEAETQFLFDTNQGTKWGHVTCPQCAACGPEVRTDYGPVEDWKDKAIEEWNTRAEVK